MWSVDQDANTHTYYTLFIIKKELIIVTLHKVAGALYIVSEKVSADAVSPVWQ